MRLTVLGRHGLYPPRGGACSSYFVSLNCGTRILLDCGPGTLTRFPDGMIEELDILVLSHLHWDHVSDVLPLRYALERMDKHIALMLPEEPSVVASLLTNSPMITPYYLHDGMRYDGGAFSMRFFAMRHPLPAYGVRIEEEGKALAYSGDTNTCENLEKLLEGGPDIALVDACFSDEQWTQDKPHLSARLAARAMREGGVRIPLLAHLPPGEDEYALMRQARQEYSPALFAVAGRTYDTDA